MWEPASAVIFQGGDDCDPYIILLVESVSVERPSTAL